MKNVLLLPVLSYTLLVSLPSTAADAPNYAESTLTGDWGGARSAMAQKGLMLDIGYKVDLLRNMSGGIPLRSRTRVKLPTASMPANGWPCNR